MLNKWKFIKIKEENIVGEDSMLQKENSSLS